MSGAANTAKAYIFIYIDIDNLLVFFFFIQKQLH